MKRRWLVRVVLSVTIGLGVLAGLARAQEPPPVLLMPNSEIPEYLATPRTRLQAGGQSARTLLVAPQCLSRWELQVLGDVCFRLQPSILRRAVPERSTGVLVCRAGAYQH